MTRKTRKLTFKITRADRESFEFTRRYSKVGPLVITRAIEVKTSKKYVVTHAISGRAIARLSKLSQARQAMKLLLPLANWAQRASKLEDNTNLLEQCRHVLASLPDATVSTSSTVKYY